VELGGWDAMGVIRNAPGHLVEEVAKPVVDFTLRMAASSPRLEITETLVEHLGAQLYRVRVVVKNLGYLPTHLTEMGLQTGEIPGVTVKIATANATLLMNEAVRELGHLDGMSSRRTAWSGWNPPWGTDSRMVEWLVRADSENATVTVEAAAQKAGTQRKTLALSAF
jgi:hypothetical protein